MIITGLQKTTLLDYPEKLACTVFLQGCNFDCWYCHNRSLIRHLMLDTIISEKELHNFLDSRLDVLEGIVISGGEPTVNADLPKFLDTIREMHPSLNIKLDTNGSDPSVIKTILRHGLVDYIAMDIKTVPEKYSEVIGCDIDPEVIEESISIILNDQYINNEFRTTCLSGIHSDEIFEEIGELVDGCDMYALQPFDPSSFGETGWGKYIPSYEDLNSYRNVLLPYAEEVVIRGVH